MASITQQILLELNVTGNEKISRALEKTGAAFEEAAEKNRELGQVSKANSRQLSKLKKELTDNGLALRDVIKNATQWRQALEGNDIILDKVTKSVREKIKIEKSHAAALREDVIRTEKKRTDILKLQSQAIKEDFLRTEKKRTNILKLQSEAIKEDFLRTEKKRIDMLKIQTQAIRENIEFDRKKRKAIKSVRQELILLNTEYKRKHKINIAEVADKKLLKQAYSGNTFALKRLKQEMKLYRGELLKQDKASLLSLNSNRLLGGSFATLRSKMLLASFGFGIFSRTLLRYAKEAGNVVEITSKFNVVFGELSSEATISISKMADRLGFANSTLMDFASTFQDTFVPLGFARDESARLSLGLTKLAVDVASFSNKMDADVVRDFQSAIVGNHETVKKYGIIINEARLEQEAYDSGLANSGETLSDIVKVMARYQLIVKGSDDAIGDKERTLDSYNNALKDFNEQLKISSQEIGETIIPLATGLLKIASHLADKSSILGYASSLSILASGFLTARIHTLGLTKALGLFRGKLIATGIGAFIVGLGEAIAALDRHGRKINEAEAGYKEYVSNISKARAALMETSVLNDTLADQETKLRKLEKERDYQLLFTLEGKVIQQKKELNSDTKEQNKAINEQIQAIQVNIERLNEEKKSRESVSSGFNEQEESIKKLIKSYEDQILILEQTTELDKRLTEEALNLGKANKDELSPAVTEIITNLVNKEQAIKDATEAEKEATRVSKAFAKTQKKELSDANKKAIKEFNDLKKSIKDLGKELEISSTKRFADEAFARDLAITQYLELQHGMEGLSDRVKDEIKNRIALLDIEILDNINKGKSIKLIEKQIKVRDKLNNLIKGGIPESDTEGQVEGLEKYSQTLQAVGIVFSSLSQTASMYFSSQEAGLRQEMAELKNSDEFKRKSKRGQERDIKDLASKQRNTRVRLFNMQKAMNLAQITMDTASAIMSIYAQVPKFDFGISAATLAKIVGGLGAVQFGIAASQKMPAFAKGGDFITDRPMPILVGEAGRERVTITPVDRPDSMALGSMGGVTVNFTGNVLTQDFIEDEAIPMIKEAVRRGADLGVA